MWKKTSTFTFKNGITVIGVLESGVIRPFEYNSQIKAEKICHKFFEDGIYATVIESFTHRNKYYIQIVNSDINKMEGYNIGDGEFLKVSQIIKRGLTGLTTRRVNMLCSQLKIKYPEKITGGGQGKGYRIHSSILNLFQRGSTIKNKNEFTENKEEKN